MSTASLPSAPFAPDASLQHFAEMPVDFVRLRASTLAATGDPADNWFALMLWGAAWHQMPAGSLPDDDAALAYLAGLGRDIRAWKKHRAGALRGWVKHDDGRLYHPVVTEKVGAALDTSRKAKAAIRARWDKQNSSQGDQEPENKGNGSNGRNTGAGGGVLPGSDRNGSDLNGRDSGGARAPATPKKRPSKPSTRLPEDWTLPSEWRADTLKDHPLIDPDFEAKKFKNYWLGANKNATSPNWRAKWATWLGNAKPTPGYTPPRERTLLDGEAQPVWSTQEQQDLARCRAWQKSGFWNENQNGPPPDDPQTRVSSAVRKFLKIPTKETT
jgi:hypothetical protein